MKNPEKSQQSPRPVTGPSQEEIQTAYQVHTVAQMLYGQLAMTHPWLTMTPPMRGAEPMMGFQAPPWAAQAYPVMWGYPQRWSW